ncbi:undecaprenyl/decaprenyl-phosphate alpha-N-acetylglucosaminyl 1-phosphate transferase, partial [Patescibacteria group bacterium]|nr:undecaprenyl/decaprenyl-phosphate alpha-N-acetylglucosaminyl 1-phosphate transferase [Patescibacteria group bacterium]
MNLILPAISALFATLLATTPTVLLAKRFKLVDSPKTRPHPAHTQSRTVPRAGGLPVFIGIILAILLFTPFEKTTCGILLGLTILLVVGLLDDKYQNLSPYFRLITQFLAATVVVASGVNIHFITNPLGGIINFDSVFLLADILAIFWIVWIMNMVNWSKGVDGQMPGIICVAAIILGLLALKLNLLGDPSQLTVVKLAFITAGSAFALLIVNWHPAKIFPGFSGSTILGFMIAVLAILS